MSKVQRDKKAPVKEQQPVIEEEEEEPTAPIKLPKNMVLQTKEKEVKAKRVNSEKQQAHIAKLKELNKKRWENLKSQKEEQLQQKEKEKEEETEPEEEVVYIKKAKPKKKKKIVYVEEESSSEEEQVIKRQPKQKKKAMTQALYGQPQNDPFPFRIL